LAFLPITLGVGQAPVAGKGGAQSRIPTKDQTEKTLKRDDYSCRFCGFRSPRFQRTTFSSNISGDLPFATCCTFCDLAINLDRAGVIGSGILIWLPEIGQAELNHIIRAIYIAREQTGELASAANRALDALTTRRAEAKKRLGSEDPLLLSTVLTEMVDGKNIQDTLVKLDGIRLLPPDKHLMRTSKGDVDQFPSMIKFWASTQGPYAHLPVENWLDTFKTASAKIGHA
jgi:intracellular multiplication protein IcmJ